MSSAFYGQDSYSVKRLNVIAGIRWERVEGYLPAQVTPASRYFPDGLVFQGVNIGGVVQNYTVRKSFDAVHEDPLWYNWAPRVAATYDLFSNGKTAIKASYGKYLDQINTGTPPNANGAISQTYNWVDKALTATNGISGSFAPAASSLVYSAAGSVTARMIDYGTLRVRGGWATNSFFMPYATFGLAVGRMDINRNVLVTPAATGATPPGTVVTPPFAVSENLLNQFGYGYAAGLGVDFCLMANLFMRAEYEYVQFPDFHGLDAHMHNVRVGAALKF